MGLLNGLRNQLIDIIQWLDDTGDTLVWRFPRYENEIKNGAKLIVRESQSAAFINEGKLADVFVPGTYTLTTQNLPILATLKGWKYGFESPFKAEVYFVSTRTFTDRKWGTQNPILLRDAEFGMVRLRAFGTFAMRVKDAGTFLKQVAGTEAQFTVDQIEDQLRDLVTSRFADALGQNKVAALDLAGNYDKVSRWATACVQPDFEQYGLELVKLVVENISLPPEVEAMVDKRSSMGVIGNMQQYTQFETANAIRDAASNPGGLGGIGAGLAAGMAVGNQMGGAINAQSGPAPVPPPVPTGFYAVIAGTQAGPFAITELAAKMQSGEITPATLLWKQGMSGWTAASGLPEVANILASVPPPLPKA